MNTSHLALDTQEAANIARTLRYPPSAARVLPLLKRLLQDLDVSIFQIAEAIRLDPGIAARVLHAANSVIYNRGERCTSVAAAVNMIGFENIYEMVANAVAEQVLVMPLASYSLEAEEFWLRSVAAAIAAEQIAAKRELDPNVAYTLGLLSGIGMVAIDQWIRVNQANVALFKRDFPRDYCDSERVLLGCTNADVGALVLQSWDFPPEMSLPLRWQYNPWDSRGHRNLTAMLFCAKWVSVQACRTDGQTAAPPDSRALATIGLTPHQLSALVQDVRTRLREVQRQLDFQPLEAA
jgi:HD-like signal output (HDOD) protein